jgi:hypothetical protein
MRRLRNWNTCCCRYHQELTKLIELTIVVDNMRTDKHGVHSHCPCDCVMVCGGLGFECGSGLCNAGLEVFARLTNLWTSVVCPKDDFSMWYKRDCFLGKCIDCGVKLLWICPLELRSEKVVK